MFPATTHYYLGDLQLCSGEASPYSEESPRILMEEKPFPVPQDAEAGVYMPILFFGLFINSTLEENLV